jgi:hypothetical protein
VLSGLDCLGVKRSQARKVVRTIAFDSVPPNRLRVYGYLKALKGNRPLPTTTAHRALEELVIYGLAARIPQGAGRPDLWRAV